jgi:hypothetical protein
MTKEKLKIEFGQPEHGWLPVDFKHGEFELHFEASDVPVNPMDQLISGIRQIIQGIKMQVWWHLEPGGYYFDFEKEGENYKLRILFSDTSTTDRELIFETQGNYDNIIMPFYRSIRNFFTRIIEEPHWPKTEEIEIKKLTELVKDS